jgi:hypothetical protein
MKKFIVLLLAIGIAQCYAQEKRIYGLSLFSQATALPSFNLVKNPIHPGIQATVNWSSGRASGMENYGFRELAVGAFHHNHIQTAMYASYSWGYHYDVTGGLYAEGLAGLGYLHSFTDKAIYRPLEEGGFEQKTDFGRPQALVSFQLGLGYRFPNSSISPFIRYGFHLQGPFAPDNGFPFNPLTTFHIGASFSF